MSHCITCTLDECNVQQFTMECDTVQTSKQSIQIDIYCYRWNHYGLATWWTARWVETAPNKYDLQFEMVWSRATYLPDLVKSSLSFCFLLWFTFTFIIYIYIFCEQYYRVKNVTDIILHFELSPTLCVIISNYIT